MFRFLTVAIVAISANAITLQEDEGLDLGLDLSNAMAADHADLEVPHATNEEVAAVATILECPDSITLPDGLRRGGESVIDEMVRDFNNRQEWRAESQEGRAARRAERKAILESHQPDYTTV